MYGLRVVCSLRIINAGTLFREIKNMADEVSIKQDHVTKMHHCFPKPQTTHTIVTDISIHSLHSLQLNLWTLIRVFLFFIG